SWRCLLHTANAVDGKHQRCSTEVAADLQAAEERVEIGRIESDPDRAGAAGGEWRGGAIVVRHGVALALHDGGIEMPGLVARIPHFDGQDLQLADRLRTEAQPI